MRTYLISYDLADQPTKRHAIAETIMMLGDRWARPLDQTWYVTFAGTETELVAALAPMIDEHDGMLIQMVANTASLTNTSVRWFKQRGAKAAANNVLSFPRAETITSSVEIDWDMAEAV